VKATTQVLTALSVYPRGSASAGGAAPVFMRCLRIMVGAEIGQEPAP
jgi:hypothetical protein